VGEFGWPSGPFQIFFATGALLLLAACGGEPSEADIKSAFEKQIAAESKAMDQFGGKGMADQLKGLIPEVKIIKKIGCKEDGENAYKCDVEMEVTQMGNTNKGIAPVRFVKGSDGWMASK
jgi:hypothetical protein